MSTVTAFRTRDARVLDAWCTGEQQLSEWKTRFTEGCVTLAIDPAQVIANTWSGHIKGVRHSGEDPIPDGWRYDKRASLLMPALKTAAGRRIAATLKGLKRPMPADGLPGMPYTHFSGDGLFRVRMHLLVDGSLYADWACRVSDTCIDLAIWERIKLSVYYAAVEAHEESTVQPVPDGGETRA